MCYKKNLCAFALFQQKLKIQYKWALAHLNKSMTPIGFSQNIKYEKSNHCFLIYDYRM